MKPSKILVLCEDSSRFARVRGSCGALGRGVFRGTTDLDVALELLEDRSIAMVIVDGSKSVDLEAVCALLHAASQRRRPVPVVVINERFDARESTLLFQLGVADCLNHTIHRDRLAETVAELAGLEPPTPIELELAAKAYPAPRMRRTATAV